MSSKLEPPTNTASPLLGMLAAGTVTVALPVGPLPSALVAVTWAVREPPSRQRDCPEQLMVKVAWVPVTVCVPPPDRLTVYPVIEEPLAAAALQFTWTVTADSVWFVTLALTEPGAPGGPATVTDDEAPEVALVPSSWVSTRKVYCPGERLSTTLVAVPASVAPPLLGCTM